MSTFFQTPTKSKTSQPLTPVPLAINPTSLQVSKSQPPPENSQNFPPAVLVPNAQTFETDNSVVNDIVGSIIYNVVDAVVERVGVKSENSEKILDTQQEEETVKQESTKEVTQGDVNGVIMEMTEDVKSVQMTDGVNMTGDVNMNHEREMLKTEEEPVMTDNNLSNQI